MDMDGAADVAGKTVYGFSGVFCEQCGTLVSGRGRGPRRRFCSDPCRMVFWRDRLKDARRLGELASLHLPGEARQVRFQVAARALPHGPFLLPARRTPAEHQGLVPAGPGHQLDVDIVTHLLPVGGQ